MKLYKPSMLIAAAVTAILMAWCGVVAAVAPPVLVIYAVEARDATGVLMLVVLALSGLITAHLCNQMPAPIPQLLTSIVLGTGYTAITAWLDNFTAVSLETTLSWFLVRPFQVAGLILPAVAAVSALFSVFSAFEKQVRRKSHAVLNFFTLLALIITAESVMTLFDLPVLRWQRIAPSVPALSISRYRHMLQSVIQAYTSIPPLFRLITGGLCLLILGRAQYVAGLRKVQRHSAAAVRSRSVTPPPARHIAAVSRLAAVTQDHRSRNSGMNAQDSAMLDALAAQTISGRPIGLNTATGVPSVAGMQR